MRITKVIVSLSMVLGVSSAEQASAKLRVDDGKGETTFRVDGAEVSASQAYLAGAQGKTVLKCKPKDAKGEKEFYGADGKAMGKVVECTPQDLVVNPKTGGTTFKPKKK
jgi:hypothetical protein